MNIVCVRENDDPVEAMLLIKRLNADGVLAPPPLMKQLEEMRHFITKQPQLNCRIKGPLTSVDQYKQREGVKLHWLPPTIVIKGQRSRNTTTSTANCKDFKQTFAEPVEVDLRVGITGDSPKSFSIIDGGVTGHESVWIDQKFIDRTCEHGWSACAGGMGWDRLFVPADQMTKAHQELYTRVYQNQTAGCSNPAG